MNPFYRAIAHAIGDASGRPFELKSISHLGGGCINEAVKLAGTDGSCWFLKSNTSADTTMFAAEFDGLKALAATNTVRVPRPLVFGEAEGQAWLAMEFLELGKMRPDSGDSRLADVPLSRPSATLSPVPNGGKGQGEGVPNVQQTRNQISTQEKLGRELAALHRLPQPYFGWHRDNTIGSTPQRNPRADDWITFWREHRLGFQLELARTRGGSFPGANHLLDRLEELFEGYEPQPSLLHGDLWSGNVGWLGDGSPVIFDPACYFGDREAEFGIIAMFGGFTEEFYRGYHSVWPLDEGFPQRLPLYELYHTLNHFNLFGGGYAAAGQRLMDRVLRNL